MYSSNKFHFATAGDQEVIRKFTPERKLTHRGGCDSRNKNSDAIPSGYRHYMHYIASLSTPDSDAMFFHLEDVPLSNILTIENSVKQIAPSPDRTRAGTK